MDKAFNLLKTVVLIGVIIYIIGFMISEEFIMDFNLLKTVVLIGVIIYIIGFMISEEFIMDIVKPLGEKLAPFGIKILHLR